MTKKTPAHGPRRAGGSAYATRPGLRAITVNRQGDQHHFFASSLGRWKVGYDLQTLIAAMKTDGLPFNVFLVPGPENRPYKIEYFVPQVEGVQFLAFYGTKDDLAEAEARIEALTLREEPKP